MEQLRNELLEIINNSTLPAECIFYIFKDVFRDLQEQYKVILEQQATAQAAALPNIEAEGDTPSPQEEKEVK